MKQQSKLRHQGPRAFLPAAFLAASLVATSCGNDDTGQGQAALDPSASGDSGPTEGPAPTATTSAAPSPPTDASDGSNVPPISPSAADRGCAVNDDCTLVQKTCCLGCGLRTADYFWAIRSDRTTAYGASLTDACTAAGLMGCVTCGGTQDPASLAACVDGVCEAVNIRSRDDITGCTSHDECTVRAAGCCQCEGPDLVAVADETAYTALTCDGATTCPACPSTNFGSARGVCNGGTCEVVYQ